MTTKTSEPSPAIYASMSEAARMIGVSRVTLRERVIDGQLPAVRVGKGRGAAVRVKVADLEALLHPVAAGGDNDTRP